VRPNGEWQQAGETAGEQSTARKHRRQSDHASMHDAIAVDGRRFMLGFGAMQKTLSSMSK
jgi:hypothetical protein